MNPNENGTAWLSRKLPALLPLILLPLLAIMLHPDDAGSAAPDGLSETADFPTPGSLRVVNAFPNLTFNSPVGIAQAGDERLFIVEQAGKIAVVRQQGASWVKEEFLDISESVYFDREMGLLGLAFHPDFKQNGYFYVNYTYYEGPQLVTRISRFEVTQNANKADPQSETIILEVLQPATNHNGGKLAFGKDGYLYIGLGDGGGSGDPDNNAQNLNSLLGKILRLDMNKSDGGLNYGIPDDNPFVGKDGRDEIWAWGLRNPWQFSFDPLNGDLYIGDVGQSRWEEIDYQAASSPGGENYGWRLKEGSHCYNPQSDCDPANSLIDPVHEYGHDLGCSITGGVVYRGSDLPDLQGTYLFIDYCRDDLRGLRRDSAQRWQAQPLVQAGQQITAFGSDVDGEVYLANKQTGEILGLRPQPQRELVFMPVIFRGS